MFKRIGVELDRTTLANWMIKMGVLVQPLINRLSEIANEGVFGYLSEYNRQITQASNNIGFLIS